MITAHEIVKFWLDEIGEARWYVPGEPRRFATVPTEQLLCVGFDMPPATLHGKSSMVLSGRPL